MSQIEFLINVIENVHKVDKTDLIKLLTCEDASAIYTAADRVRKKFVGDIVHLRGLIEFSSYCCRTCFYCGLRVANNKPKRYRMKAAEIIECAKYAVNSGLKTVVLQSGEDKFFEINDICKIVDEIKKMDVAVTLSIGELQKHEYAALKDSGADRYLLRIETSNKQLYEKLHPGMSYDNRTRCLYDLKELGYETGTGCLIGLPGQTIEMLADDLLFFKKLDTDMIGMGPFIPCLGTPLEFKPGGNSDVVLRMMALVRLLLPDINIPVTTALGVKDNDGYKKGLNCGANVIMPNVGKIEYRNLYSIYPGKEEKTIPDNNQIEYIKNIVIQEGREIGHDYGGRKNSNKLTGGKKCFIL